MPEGTDQATVSHFMSRQVLAIREDCSLGTTLMTVMASGHRHVVVVDRAGSLLAVLPADAVADAARSTSPGCPVGDLVPVPQARLSPDDSMRHAAATMLALSVDALGVVTAGGQLLGILCWSDIVGMVAVGGS